MHVKSARPLVFHKISSRLSFEIGAASTEGVDGVSGVGARVSTSDVLVPLITVVDHATGFRPTAFASTGCCCLEKRRGPTGFLAMDVSFPI